MGVSEFPPSRHEALKLGIQGERSGAEFAKRLRSFAYARAAVFSGAGILVLLVLGRNHDEFVLTYSVQFILAIVLIALASAAFQFWVSRVQRHMQNVAMMLLLLDQALFASIVYLTGGVSSGATSLLGVTCVAGGVLLGLPGAIIAVVAGIIFFSLILLIVEGAHDLLPPDQPASLYTLGTSQSVYYYVFTIFMLLLVGLLSGYLAERLARASGEVIAAKERVKRAEKLAVLGRLAAGLAHEIRNPLSSISGAVQMLRSGVVRGEDRELCDIVVRESVRLDELISDMLELSKVREKKVEIFDLRQLILDVALLSQRSGRGGADVAISVEANEPAFIQADPSQIKQLSWNLVKNAIQASAGGGEVRLRVQTGATVRLVVEDDGVGIRPEAMQRLFDEFFTTRTHGTGLGLAVVKRIADDHGILLIVESDRDQGARFIADFGPPLPAELLEV